MRYSRASLLGGVVGLAVVSIAWAIAGDPAADDWALVIPLVLLMAASSRFGPPAKRPPTRRVAVAWTVAAAASYLAVWASAMALDPWLPDASFAVGLDDAVAPMAGTILVVVSMIALTALGYREDRPVVVAGVALIAGLVLIRTIPWTLPLVAIGFALIATVLALRSLGVGPWATDGPPAPR